jgi:hypothetical protein
MVSFHTFKMIRVKQTLQIPFAVYDFVTNLRPPKTLRNLLTSHKFFTSAPPTIWTFQSHLLEKLHRIYGHFTYSFRKWNLKFTHLKNINRIENKLEQI